MFNYELINQINIVNENPRIMKMHDTGKKIRWESVFYWNSIDQQLIFQWFDIPMVLGMVSNVYSITELCPLYWWLFQFWYRLLILYLLFYFKNYDIIYKTNLLSRNVNFTPMKRNLKITNNLKHVSTTLYIHKPFNVHYCLTYSIVKMVLIYLQVRLNNIKSL